MAERSVTTPSTRKELKDTLWKAADKLRGSMSAAQYKDVVLGLIFLKYVSDAFQEKRDQIAEQARAEGLDEEDVAETLEDRDEYASGAFWVDPDARWAALVADAKVTEGSTIGQRINEAMDLLMRDNTALQGTLPRLFNGNNVDQRRLAELMDLLNSVQFSGQGAAKARDLLGEVYEYFLANFALSEGHRGGEFYTPASVVRIIVEVLQPKTGRVYDPCCGSGGMFVQAEKFLEAHDADPTNLAVYGQELNESTWRMAKMNLAIHGLGGNLGPRWGDTFALDFHSDVQMDFVMANPPFNIKDWNRRESDPRWVYGVPPAKNANYAWMQHILSKLAPGGTAGVVMANGSMTSSSNGEGDIRAQFVEHDMVAAMVALPDKLFRSTGIPACLWFFARDKGVGPGGSVDRRGQVLFIDAREMGYMITRAQRGLRAEEIQRIADTVHAWRGMEQLAVSTADVTVEEDAEVTAAGAEYEDVAGFCKSVSTAEIKAAGYALTPGRYVGVAEAPEDAEPLDEKIARLTKSLNEQLDEASRLGDVVREQLRSLS